MPNRDGTGPMGRGAGTGFGRGPCGWSMQRNWRNRLNRWFGPYNSNQQNPTDQNRQS